MTYCLDTTRSHPISITNITCLEPINQIILKEGGRNTPFSNDQIALNLDQVEVNSGRAQLRQTMDFCFGISQNGQNRQVVLTELKLRVVNPRTIGRSDVEGKVVGSISILRRDIDIYATYYFVFQQNKIQQARRHFAFLFNNNPRSPYKTILLSDLLDYHFN